MVYRESDQDKQGLGLFFRYSHVEDNVYRFAYPCTRCPMRIR